MSILKDVRSVKVLTTILKKFSNQKVLTANEFIDNLTAAKKISKRLEDIYTSFLILAKNEAFLRCLTERYLAFYKLKLIHKEIPIVLFYAIIFELDQENYENTEVIFTNFKFYHILQVVEYFLLEKNLVDIVQCGCRYFSNEYILENVLYSIFNKSELICKLYKNVYANIVKKKTPFVKPPTKPVTPTFMSRSKEMLVAVPLNTPNSEMVESEVPKMCRDIPMSTYKADKSIQRRLAEAHDQHRQRAVELLEFARNNAFSVSKVVKREEPPPTPLSPIVIHKVPNFFKKDVHVKTNATSLMREAARMVKEKKDEIKKLEVLTQSVFDPTIYEEVERNVRECREQEYVQEIERKHLKGLITREEAILAKNNLLKVNREKMEQFKLERADILEEIEKWRQTEQEKLKALVEKYRDLDESVREAERKMLQDKQNNARLVAKETEEILREAYAKKEEELARKVRLIQEFRELEQLRDFDRVKEFDPTETPNFGLLCEMSIAELQKRLEILKTEMEEELERRKKAVAEGRQKQQQLIEDVKEFIDQSKREAKVKIVPRSSVKLEQTPEIIALRERLQQVRQARMNV